MNSKIEENNKFITASLLILALVAVAFTLNFTKPIMIPFVLALLIRILIDPIIDFQTNKLQVHRIIAVFVSLILIVILFIIIVPFIIGSVATFLQSADDYNNKVKDTDKVIFISEKGEISSILANGFVENLGKNNIYSLDGGIQALIKDNFELTKN